MRSLLIKDTTKEERIRIVHERGAAGHCGRRRVGKTFLIKQYFSGRFDFMLTVFRHHGLRSDFSAASLLYPGFFRIFLTICFQWSITVKGASRKS